jgi:hypothetical protein
MTACPAGDRAGCTGGDVMSDVRGLIFMIVPVLVARLLGD